ncbi:hypothetical protein ACFFUB_07780 [Algimonas porphyrae]|uniref:Uncharacterized protein n=1 Tax=Algimonas porphyrae TaxID=1128113 RepID=A0ABQ5V0F4_9PROT|nr:hypothetical protein [Algimonas porphyrae]GLQ20926.1 hypothetical protein GCM10007854_18810 [Algimonas porphyrae]
MTETQTYESTSADAYRGTKPDGAGMSEKMSFQFLSMKAEATGLRAIRITACLVALSLVTCLVLSLIVALVD